MGTVIVDLFMLAVVVGGGAMAAFVLSKNRDRRTVEVDRARRSKEEQTTAWERKRHQPGVPLVCMNCETQFEGPLSITGCPECNMSSLVITQEEFQNKSETQQKPC